MKKILATLVALCTFVVLAFGLTTPTNASPAPAGEVSAKVVQAKGECTMGVVCGGIVHYAPDDGYDSAFLVRCDYGNDATMKYVFEGQRSSQHCKDTDQVYVNSGTQIACWDGWGFSVRYDAWGWHKIYDHQNPICVYQLD